MASPEERQRLLRDAFVVLDSRPSTSLNERATRDLLRFAIIAHDDGEEPCDTEPGAECLSVRAARRVLARYGPPEPQPEAEPEP